MKFKQGSYYFLNDGTIGEAHYTGQFWIVDMTLFRTKEELEEAGIDTNDLEEPAFTYKGKEFFGNGDFYSVSEDRVVKKLKKLTLKMQLREAAL